MRKSPADQAGKPTLVQVGLTAIEMLVEAQGEVVEREKIMKTLWRGKVVEDSNLAVQILNLRDILRRSRIQTVSGRGYRFVAPVKRRNGQATSRVSETLKDEVHSRAASVNRGAAFCRP